MDSVLKEPLILKKKSLKWVDINFIFKLSCKEYYQRDELIRFKFKKNGEHRRTSVSELPVPLLLSEVDLFDTKYKQM